MKTLINISNVTDNSAEPPTVTYSNPVTTVVRQTDPTPVYTRYFHDCPCNCCCNCCGN